VDAVERLAWLAGLAANPAITLASLKVAVALANRHNAKTGRLNPSVSMLASDTGLVDRSVRRGLDQLRASGFVHVAKSSGGHPNATNHYRLETPDSPVTPPLTSESVVPPDRRVTPTPDR
jgi:hypothetical protein